MFPSKSPLVSTEHARSLKEKSGISDETIAQRGYTTITIMADLKKRGFGAQQCNVPALLIPIYGTDGQESGYVTRPDMPRFREGKIVKYEIPNGMRMVLDIPPAARPMIGNLSKPLFITEGIKKADSAVSRGLCCIALLGVWNWRGKNQDGGLTALVEWESIALNGRDIYIVFDSDVMTKPNVHASLARLKGFLEGRKAKVYVIYLPGGEGQVKTGLDDFFVAGNDVSDLLKLATPNLIDPPAGSRVNAGDMTATEQLLSFCEHVGLFHDDHSTGFARFLVDDHYEVCPIRSRAFADWLTRQFYEKNHKPQTPQALEEALSVLESRARYDGKEHPLSVRTYQDEEGNLWYDLSDEKWGVMKITPNGWEIVAKPQPLFRRYAITDAQVEPIKTAETMPKRLEYLRQFVNISNPSSWYLVLAWLVAAFFPNIPHPVLVIYGEQGSAKTTLMGLLIKLIDPSKTLFRSEPRDSEAWVQMADHCWVIGIDNVSYLSKWFSDALCRAVTGDSVSKRQLYTDSKDVFFSFQRVIVMTGIEMPVRQPDLLERTILLRLDPITPDRRRLEKKLRDEFEELRPVILGALLEAVADVLSELPNVRSSDLPRMADFAQIGIALESVAGWPPGTFMNAYMSNIGEQNDEAIYASSIGGRIVKFMDYNQRGWRGSAEKLLVQLQNRLAHGVRPSDWPKSPHTLSGQLTRLKPALRANGILVEIGRDSKGRYINLSHIPPPAPKVAQSCDMIDMCDAPSPTVGEEGAN